MKQKRKEDAPYSIIVAMDRHNAIGFENELPWGMSLKDDLANFKKLTTGTSVIMGRKTFESLDSRPLPDRENIVVTSKPTGVKGVLSVMSLESAYTLARYPIFIIGGGQIYESALADAEKLYVTYVDSEFPNATVFFPQIACENWTEISRDHHEADERNRYAFDFVEYERTQP